MLGADPFGFADRRLVVDECLEVDVTLIVPRHVAAGTAVDDHISDDASAVELQRFVDDRLKRQRLAAADLLVGGDHGDRPGIDDALVQRLRREAAEHDRMRRADPRAGLHCRDAFDRHRHINDHAITRLHAQPAQPIREPVHAGKQFLVAHAGHVAVVGLEHDRGTFPPPGFDMTVEAVIGNVELAVLEPLVERCVRFVEHLGERCLPGELLAREPRPEPFVVVLGRGDQFEIRIHTGDRGLGGQFGRRRENTVLLKNRFDCRHLLPLVLN